MAKYLFLLTALFFSPLAMAKVCKEVHKPQTAEQARGEVLTAALKQGEVLRTRLGEVGVKAAKERKEWTMEEVHDKMADFIVEQMNKGLYLVEVGFTVESSGYPRGSNRYEHDYYLVDSVDRQAPTVISKMDPYLTTGLPRETMYYVSRAVFARHGKNLMELFHADVNTPHGMRQLNEGLQEVFQGMESVSVYRVKPSLSQDTQ